MEERVMCTNETPKTTRRILATIEARARAVAIDNVKRRARLYAPYPSSLESISPGLSLLRPRGIVNQLQSITEVELPIERYFGFGGEIRAINRKGAMLYARYSRFVFHRLQAKHG
jgi:hypothetical protein